MQPPKLGTPIDAADFKSGKLFSVTYQPRAEYAWDTGPAIGRYLAELQQGRLVGRRCHRCDRTFIPPRSFCERCFGVVEEWVTLPDTGTINTFSICHITWDMQPADPPLIPAVIEIDGTSPMHGILHLVGGVAADRVRIGLRVRAVWKPPAERTGAITDIRHFAPVEGAR